MNAATIKQAPSTVSMTVEQYDKANLHLSIARDFFNFVSQDLERDDSILNSMDSSSQQGILCGIGCLLTAGIDSLQVA